MGLRSRAGSLVLLVLWSGGEQGALPQKSNVTWSRYLRKAPLAACGVRVSAEGRLSQ